jgi:hypothetical protein
MKRLRRASVIAVLSLLASATGQRRVRAVLWHRV